MHMLAINGGTPLRNQPYPMWPAAQADEEASLYQVLASCDWDCHSRTVSRLSRRFADYTGTGYALPLSSGTTSLEVIFRAIGIVRGDEVITPIYTFIASVSAICRVGATPVFADIEYDTHQLDAVSVERNITPRTKAILAVHIGGTPCDLDAMLYLSRKYGIPLIEDAAQAHGAQWRDQCAGAIGLAGSFSFQASKNLAAGEGGMAVTNSHELYARMLQISGCVNNPGDDYGWLPEVFSIDSGMGAWQAAVLLEQLKTADVLMEKRMNSCKYLINQLSQFTFLEQLRQDSRVTRDARHLLMMKYKKQRLNSISRERFLDALAAEGITVFGSGYSQPINQMPCMASRDFRKITGADCCYDTIETPVADKVALEEGIWMIQPAMLEDQSQLDLIVQAMAKIQTHTDEL